MLLAYDGSHYEHLIPTNQDAIDRSIQLVAEFRNNTYAYNKLDINRLVDLTLPPSDLRERSPTHTSTASLNKPSSFVDSWAQVMHCLLTIILK